MLSNCTNVTSSTAKPLKHARLWPVNLSLAMLAVFIMASTGSAASPQPQPQSTKSTSQAQAQAPNATCPPDGQCFADVPSTNPFYTFINRIYMQDLVTGYSCGGPGELCDPYSRPYYRPVNNVTRQQMAKFIDNARHKPGIYIDSSYATPIYARTTITNGVGVWGSVTHITGIGVMGIASQGGTGVQGTGSPGVKGTSTGGYGVYGESNSSYGVVGIGSAGSSRGVWAVSTNGYGLYAESTYGTGVYAESTTSWAGYFLGNVHVTGNLSKGGGSFKIDHPLDPANKYLYHSFVESPDMMNVYNGNVTTDGKGEAAVTLPDYFEALNRDFRYQLTTIGQHADAWIASEIKDNKFVIETDKPNVKVSWQVTGIRQDPYANAHRIPVEQDKPADEKGKYLHPTEWGQPESSGIDYAEQQRMQQPVQSKP
jgi:hypothetical protein